MELGRSIAEGRGYSFFGQPFTHFMPGWPLVVSAVFATGLGLRSAQALLCLVSTLIGYEAYLLGSRVASERAGVVAAWLVAIFPPLIWYSRIPMSETFSAALLGGWAVAGLYYVTQDERRSLLVGLWLLGATLPYFRAELVVLVPLPFLVRAINAPPLREALRAIVACVCVGAALAPWWLYNERRFHERILLSTAGGIGLWIASHDPPLKEFDHPDFRDAAARLSIPGQPKATDRHFAAEARVRIRADPLKYLKGRLTDLPRFFLGSHTEMVPGAERAVGEALRQRRLKVLGAKLLGFGTQTLMVIGAFVGGVVAFRRGAPSFLWLIVAAKVAAHAPFVQAPRFSLHLAAILCVYAAVAVLWIWDKRRESGSSTSSP